MRWNKKMKKLLDHQNEFTLKHVFKPKFIKISKISFS